MDILSRQPTEFKRLPLYTTAFITVSDDGRFRLNGDREATIVPVRDRRDRLVDLVAYFRERPGEWFLREGDESPVLGAREIEGANNLGQPIELHPTPQAWLRAGGHGACVLDWDVPLDGIFESGVTLAHLDPQIRKGLASKLSANFKSWLPRIVGAREARRAA
jgi:hypothetical protein